MATATDETWRAHWKCFVACGVIVLTPFQYGLDFGLIGGLQAMRGFLEVCSPKSRPGQCVFMLAQHHSNSKVNARSTAIPPPKPPSDGTSTRCDSSSSRRS